MEKNEMERRRLFERIQALRSDYADSELEEMIMLSIWSFERQVVLKK